MTSPGARVAIIGGGVTGLAAAFALAEVAPDLSVTLYEAAERVGGKLRTERVAGVSVDVGAEAMLARRPEAVGLARKLGLDLVWPATTAARIWSGGALRPLPPSVLGVPADLDALTASGLLTAAGVDRAAQDRSVALGVGEDPSVGHFVEQALGAEVVDQLLEPLLGGVYAGHARELSLRAAAPAIAALASGPGGLLAAAQAHVAASKQAGPVFAGLAGGVAGLAHALAAEVSVRGVRILTSSPVTALTRNEQGWSVATSTGPEQFDGVLLAAPAAVAASLVNGVSRQAADELAQIPTASMLINTLAFRAEDLPPTMRETASSGFLVPPGEGLQIKACTLSYAKWPWVRQHGEGMLILRTSLGRLGDDVTLQLSDQDVTSLSLRDLRTVFGLTATPVDSLVTRWEAALPQYQVGHLDRLGRILQAVQSEPGLELAGAWQHGLGIPACIASAYAAVDRLAASLTTIGRMTP